MIAWNLWTGVPSVKLWEAVALVLDINPRTLKPEPHGWMGASPGREANPSFLPQSFPSDEKRRAFDEALEFAERATAYGGRIRILSTPFPGMSKRRAEVALPEVVAFFVSCEWPDIPAPLLARLPANSSEPAIAASGEKRWTPERLKELHDYRKAHGTRKAAEHFDVSESRVRELLPSEKSQKGYSVFNPRLK